MGIGAAGYPEERIQDAHQEPREASKNAGVTQVELADRMNTDQSQVSKFERCERRLDVMDYVRYCESIGLDPAILLKKIVSPRPKPQSGPKS